MPPDMPAPPAGPTAAQLQAPLFSAVVGARSSAHQHSPGESEIAQTTRPHHCSRATFTVLPSNLEHPWTPWDSLVILILFSRDARGPSIKSTLNKNDPDSPTKRLGLWMIYPFSQKDVMQLIPRAPKSRWPKGVTCRQRLSKRKNFKIIPLPPGPALRLTLSPSTSPSRVCSLNQPKR